MTVFFWGGDGDWLQLSAYGAGDATIVLSQIGSDTILTLGAGTVYESTITLQNYRLDSWHLPPGATFDGSYSIIGDAYGVATDDYIVGSTAVSNTREGYGGDDTLIAGDMGDWLFGGSADDAIEGGGGADLIYGDFSEDTIFGGDMLYGGTGDDVLSADDVAVGDGINWLYGDLGNDTLIGGDDLIPGGAGADHFQFVFYRSGSGIFDFGSDVVTYFEVGDTLEILGWGLGKLSVSFTQTGADTLITAEAGTSHESTILLEDVLVSPGSWSLSDDTFTLWG